MKLYYFVIFTFSLVLSRASARLNAVKSEPKLDLFEELVDVVDESENRELYSGYYGNNGNNYFNTNDGRGNFEKVGFSHVLVG